MRQSECLRDVWHLPAVWPCCWLKQCLSARKHLPGCLHAAAMTSSRLRSQGKGKSFKSIHGRLSAVWNNSTRNVCWMMEVSVKAAVTSQAAGAIGWSLMRLMRKCTIHHSSLLPIHHPVKLSKWSSKSKSKCHLGRWLTFHQATAAFSASFPKSSLLDMPS